MPPLAGAQIRISSVTVNGCVVAATATTDCTSQYIPFGNTAVPYHNYTIWCLPMSLTVPLTTEHIGHREPQAVLGQQCAKKISS